MGLLESVLSRPECPSEREAVRKAKTQNASIITAQHSSVS